jgi:hypothetical protein
MQTQPLGYPRAPAAEPRLDGRLGSMMTSDAAAVHEAATHTAVAALLNRVSLAGVHLSKGRLTDKDRAALRRVRRLLVAAGQPGTSEHLLVLKHGGMADFEDASALRAVVPEQDDHDFSDVVEAIDAVLGGSRSDDHIATLRTFGRLAATVGDLAEEQVQPARERSWLTTTSSLTQ